MKLATRLSRPPLNEPQAIPGLEQLETDGSATTLAVANLVGERLGRFFDGEADRWKEVSPALAEAISTLRDFVEGGGKRFRASFCYWGWRAAQTDGPDHSGFDDAGFDPGPAIDVAAAVELLHAFALIHDDVMDGSDQRRGRPSVHRQLEMAHAVAGWGGERRRFGEGVAVLLGDAALVWADCLLAPHRPAVGAVWDELRVELTMGQYLDIVGAARGSTDLDAAWLVASLKSGRYSVMRPLQLGAALADRLPALGPVYAAFGGPIGEAFQLRDDLLGVYGDSQVTGKPAGDDLREGKPTALLALAQARAPKSARAVLARVGAADLDEEDVERLRDLFDDCGATAELEAAISGRVEAGLAALAVADISGEGRRALSQLAGTAVWRHC